jgi:hypothetical protein
LSGAGQNERADAPEPIAKAGAADAIRLETGSLVEQTRQLAHRVFHPNFKRDVETIPSSILPYVLPKLDRQPAIPQNNANYRQSARLKPTTFP